VGYVLRNGRAEMTDFFALLTNPHVLVQYPHVLFSGITTAGFFVLGISAWHLIRKSHLDFFKRSAQIGMMYGLIGSVLVAMVGHTQAQHMVRAQPMKMAAAEALWDRQNPASFSLFTFGNEPERRDVFAIRIPAALSILAYNSPTGEVKGINDIEVEYQARYGPGNYAPPIALTYWSFRLMAGSGFLMIALALVGSYLALKNKLEGTAWYLKLLPLALFLPYIANSAGWLLTELGRQPWIVFGLMKTEAGVSSTVTAGMVLTSIVLFTLVYGALMVADIYLLNKYARGGPGSGEPPVPAAA
jgi:cytochrome bd ubiquinol oxidase subunit I